MREVKFRTPTRCQNGHFRWLYWSASFGVALQEWGEKHPDCKCPTFGYDEGFHKCGDDEQFTGLRDKNGKEIYEGDIVWKPYQTRPYSALSKEQMFNCLVEFNEGEFRYRRIDQSIKYRCWNSTWVDTEVIGNIYENGDL